MSPSRGRPAEDVLQRSLELTGSRDGAAILDCFALERIEASPDMRTSLANC